MKFLEWLTMRLLNRFVDGLSEFTGEARSPLRWMLGWQVLTGVSWWILCRDIKSSLGVGFGFGFVFACIAWFVFIMTAHEMPWEWWDRMRSKWREEREAAE